MSIREKLIELFKANRGVCISGEDIAERLSVSQTEIRMTVKSLQNEGCAIDVIPNKGYCLISEETDILSEVGIRKYLRSEIAGMELLILPTTSSTNAFVREKADDGAPEGYTVLAREQTSGRGRLGRVFFSPDDTGIYMSLLLRPKACAAEQAVSITTMAAVAMCEAIETVSGETAEIKWVNDIFVRGKKVCGILTEGSFNPESGLLDFAVLGLGVNMYKPKNGFPAELEKIAASVLRERRKNAKNRLVSEFLNRFYSYYTSPCRSDYVKQYRSRSLAIGKKVKLISENKSVNAVVLDIDESCHLLVKYDDGSEDCYSSGEISIRF